LEVPPEYQLVTMPVNPLVNVVAGVPLTVPLCVPV
jgi:hypothetical protein